MMSGKFLISLDFELYWGQFDQVALSDYDKNIEGVHKVVPKLLSMFEKYGIKATWAIVGAILCKNKEELIEKIPKIKPDYINESLSVSKYINTHKKIDSKYHFCPELVELLKSYNNQEIASHTFSHYYVNEEGQTLESFEADCEAQQEIFRLNGYKLPSSIIFPRNQINEKYVNLLNKYKIKCYRGVQNSSFYNAGLNSEVSFLKRIVRFFDAYINITGYHVYELNLNDKIINVKQSMFLRPYSNILFFLEFFKIRRIKKAMLYAAKNGKVFHLWWHPHNFGINQKKNLANLNKIMNYYKQLRIKYNFESLNMNDVVNGA